MATAESPIHRSEITAEPAISEATREVQANAPITEQFSHLFPAHLYVKEHNAGQLIDHCEDVSASENRAADDTANAEAMTTGIPASLFENV